VECSATEKNNVTADSAETKVEEKIAQVAGKRKSKEPENLTSVATTVTTTTTTEITATTTTEKKIKPRAKSRGRSKKAKSQAKAISASAQETDSASNTPSATPAAKLSPPACLAEPDKPNVGSTTAAPTTTTTTQTKEEMEARMTDLLVKKSEDDDSSMSDKEKAGIAWQILQFCLASRIQKVKVTQDTHILQEPPGPDKAVRLQERFVSKLNAADDSSLGEPRPEEKSRESKSEEEDSLVAAAAIAAVEEEIAGAEKIAETAKATPEKAEERSKSDERSSERRSAVEAKKASKSRNGSSSKSASQSRSRTPSVSLESQKPNGKNAKKSQKSGGKNANRTSEDAEEDLDALIAEAKKMDAERASREPSEPTTNKRSSSRHSSKAKEIPPAASASSTSEVAPAAQEAAENAAIEYVSRERNDYVEIKSNYDDMFEEFETDILLSMEEMQKMGQNSGHMESRLDAIQKRSSNQSQRFRAVKENYKALGKDLENRLKKMEEKKKEEERAEKEEAEKEAEMAEEKETTNEIDFSSSTTPLSFPENELQNALMSSLEGKTATPPQTLNYDDDEIKKHSPPPIYSPVEDDADLTDKGYTLTDDGVSDDLDVFVGAGERGKIGASKTAREDEVMSASMFVASSSREDAEDVMTSSAVSWCEMTEGSEGGGSKRVGAVAEESVDSSSAVNQDSSSTAPETGSSRQIATDSGGSRHIPGAVGFAICVVSEDSGLSDSKTSDPYDPYKGKKKRKQRPRVKSMIEI